MTVKRAHATPFEYLSRAGNEPEMWIFVDEKYSCFTRCRSEIET